MTARFNSEILFARDEVVAAPAARACTDLNWELPTGLYLATAVLFLGFVSVLSLGFMGPTMVVPYAVFVVFIAAFFTVPALFVKTSRGRGDTRALDWQLFREKGIATATGRTGAGEAATLVLLLPFLILCWAVAIVTIAALV